MNLYRGLKGSYRTEKVGEGQALHFGTNFTDCPLTALSYAKGTRGVVIVLDVPESAAHLMSEELWPDSHARRLMVWGRFDDWIIAVFPAKQLRQVIRQHGIAAESDETKVYYLHNAIQNEINPRPKTPYSSSSGR